MTARATTAHESRSAKQLRPIRSQSSHRWNYHPEERAALRARRDWPNALLSAQPGYR